jgi:hypothetical protein
VTSIYAQKMTVGHLVVHTMNNSTALISVVKGGQLGLKGRSIPRMELLLFYKMGKPTLTALLVYVTLQISLFSTSMKQAGKLGTRIAF